MASHTKSSKVINGGWPAASTTDVRSFGVAAEEHSTGAALLAKGVLVTFRSYSGGGAQEGHLQLDGESTFLLFSPVGKKNRPIRQGPTKTTMASVDEVLLEESDGENICRVLLKEGATGSSFSFQCAVNAEGFSRSYLTKFVAAALKQTLAPAQKKGTLQEKARRMTTFAEMLEPMGLVEKYDLKFRQCGILFENLSVVTREDLAEVVGITDRVDQINIMGQIKRCFLEPRADRHSIVGFRDSDGTSDGPSFDGKAMGEFTGELIGALAGL